MSGDPLISGLPAANIAAIIADELAALAADAQELGRKLTPGDVVTATVLPSNGLTDLLEVDGLRVAAELPPTLLPGQRISVQVMGLRGDRIELSILATQEDADEAGPTSRATPAPRPTPSAPAKTPSSGVAAPPGAPRPAASAMVAAHEPGTDRPAGPRAPGAPSGPGLTPYGGRPLPQRPVTVPIALESIEARLAASRAATQPTSRPLKNAPSDSRGLRPQPSTPSTQRPQSSSPLTQRPQPPPPTPRPLIAMRAVPVPAGPSNLTTPTTRPLAAAPLRPAHFTEPATLLRALRLPVTATNLASARMALDAPDRVSNALDVLERALADRTDPRLTTLNSLATFIARLDPRSPVLSEQIGAYVDHVVVGAEPKIVALARAADALHLAEPSAPLALERVALARIALDTDLKTQLLALAGPGGGAQSAESTSALNLAVSGLLTALTATQLNAAAALTMAPGGLAFTLPLVLPDGRAQAQVRIDRDGPPGGHARLDGDDFHIAFVLETKHLGIVAIDLLTVGRSVSVSVKTEDSGAQRALGAALPGLTTRLEHLRYSVAKADAVIAPTAPAPLVRAPETDRSETNVNADHLVDTDA